MQLLVSYLALCPPLTQELDPAACDDHRFLVKKDTLETVGKQEKDLCLFID